MEKLNKELTEVDRKTFNFDLSDLNWPDFIADYVQVESLKLFILTMVLFTGNKAVCLQGGFVNLG